MAGASVVDLAFGLRGSLLPEDHGLALCRAVAQVLPWLAQVQNAGIHRVKGASNGHGELLLSHRAELTLRLPERCVDDASKLAGRRIEIGAREFLVEACRVRRLLPAKTLYAARVVTVSGEEVEFADAIAGELLAHGVACETVIGMRHRVATPEGTISGYSVMLHGLQPEQSLRMQERGLGRYRPLGCGLFMRHRSPGPGSDA